MLLIFNWETRFCKFNESVPKLTVIVGVTGVGVEFTGWVFDDEEDEEELLELDEELGVEFEEVGELEEVWELLDALPWFDVVGLPVLLIGVGAVEEVALPCEEVEELLWVVLPLLPALFIGVVVGDEDVVPEVVEVGLLTGVEEVEELLLVVGLLLLLDADEDEVDPTGLVDWLLFTEVLELLDWAVEFCVELVVVWLGVVELVVEELATGWLALGAGVLVEVDCGELEVGEELVVLEATLVELVVLCEAVWDALELLTLFDVDAFVGVLSVFVELTVVLLLETVFAFVSLVEVVVFWLAGWLAVGPDDPQDTTQAGITQATAAIPITPPKIFQIFFFIQ